MEQLEHYFQYNHHHGKAYREVEVKVLVTQLYPTATPWTVAHQAPLSMEFSGKNTGVGSHSLLQRIFPTQGSNRGLLQCRQILYHLRHQGSPKHTVVNTYCGQRWAAGTERHTSRPRRGASQALFPLGQRLANCRGPDSKYFSDILPKQVSVSTIQL